MANDIVLGIRLKADGSGLVGEVKLSREELGKLVSETRNAAEEAKKTAEANRGLGSSLRDLATQIGIACAAWKAWSAVKEAALLNARYETLGVVMNVVGRNAGYMASEMEAAAQAVQKKGITMMQSRQAVVSLTQSEIDLSNATKLARLAQDAAVIGNMNSSEALGILIHGIKTAQTDVLRTIGLNVNFEQSYQKLAAQLGRSAESLSEHEKMGYGVEGFYKWIA